MGGVRTVSLFDGEPEAPVKKRRRDAWFDEFARLWLGPGWSSRLNDDCAKAVRHAAKQVRDAGFRPEHVEALWVEYGRVHPTWERTPRAVAKYAPALKIRRDDEGPGAPVVAVIDGERYVRTPAGWSRDWSAA